MKLPKLTEDQEKAITNIIRGYPLGAIRSQTLAALKRKKVVIGGQLCPELRDYWVGSHEIGPKVDPGSALLDSLTDPQLQGVFLIAQGDIGDFHGGHRGLLIKKGAVIKTDSGYQLAPIIAKSWPQWIEQNKDRLNCLFIFRARTSTPTNVTLQDLSEANQRLFELLRHPGQRDQVERFTQWRNQTVEQFNAVAQRYMENALAYGMKELAA